VLIEDDDDFIDLPEISSRLADIAWDGAGIQGRYFHAVRLTNNEFAISFLIPDSVADPLRSVLKSLL